MAVITPNSTIKLIKCPIELDQNNQLTFANATAQYNYFNGLAHLDLDDYTYQRKDGVIRVAGTRDDLQSYNYVAYQNENHGSKWFYAFIEELQYINDNMTAIKIKTDVYQTYQFDITLKQSFTEREHVADDTKGLHTVPEGLEIGDYVIAGVTNVDYGQYWICMMVSDFPEDSFHSNGSIPNQCFNGIPSGCYLMVFPNAAQGWANIRKWVAAYDAKSRSDAIVSLFMVPKSFLGFSPVSVAFTSDLGAEMPSPSNSPYNITTTTISQGANIDGYVPKNNKLFCWPYSYFYITNNCGGEAEFRWEDFAGNPSFDTKGVYAQGCSIKTYPTNYKRDGFNGGYNYGISAGKLPVCSWNSDSYINWLSQNSANSYWQAASGVAGGAISAFTGDVGGGVMSMLNSTMNAIIEVDKAKKLPDQAKGNLNMGDFNFSFGKEEPSFYKMTIRNEYARIVDDYFTMYGYKVNRLKVPATHSRSNWNFVKTIGCNLIGDLPQDDLEEIKSIFDNGVTLWHNPNTFLDYSQSNTILT